MYIGILINTITLLYLYIYIYISDICDTNYIINLESQNKFSYFSFDNDTIK